MTSTPRIALDVMGGDGGLPVIIAGAALALDRDAGLRFVLVGEPVGLAAALAGNPALAAASDVRPAAESIASNERPTVAIRRARTTSMGIAIGAVKAGDADAAVSAGNTGALMAMAKLSLRTMKGIDRPALAASLPTLGDNDLVMLDLGANTECDANNLVQFAVMGAAYSRTVLGVESPRVCLLNIGEEELKGTHEVRDAAAILRRSTHLALRFDGFIEADRLGRGEADVIVSDGFTGNIALKSMEGTARFITDLLRRAFTSSLRSKAGFVLSRPAFHMLKTHLDPNNHNGAVFLGLNGIVVKSHGGADAGGVANAVAVAAKLARDRITERIVADLTEVASAPVAAA